MNNIIKEQPGKCPAYNEKVTFKSTSVWLRDYYKCPNCNSLPRNRALFYLLNNFDVDWKNKKIHESSPCSTRVYSDCPNYSFSHYYEGEKLGKIINGVRNENIENLTFDDESFDIFITFDVMEHIFDIKSAVKEIMRVLKKGGKYIFTALKYKELKNTYQRAKIENEKIVHIHPEEYHGNPISNKGSLVTWMYGVDFEEFILKETGYNLQTYNMKNISAGIEGEFLDVFVINKEDSIE